MSNIQDSLRELSALWVNPIATNLDRIMAICREIGDAVAAGHLPSGVYPAQLCRIRVLSRRAEERITRCIASELGTGNYGASTQRQVSTAQWEG